MSPTDTVKRFISPFYQLFKSKRKEIENRIKFQRRISEIPKYNASGQNVLFIVVDCLRNDHVSYNYDRDTTPFLKEVNWNRTKAVSAAPWTFSSVPSILTGQYPRNHGAVFDTELRNQDEGNPPRIVRDDTYTLPEILASAGYETYFSTAIATAEIPIRGRFEDVSINNNEDSEYMIDELLSWWEDHEESPRCAYVHLGDLHEPLSHPDESPFGDIEDIENINRWEFGKTTKPEKEFEKYKNNRVKLYDSVLRSVDESLRTVYEYLQNRNELEDTLVVITGDHGEEFWERIELERKHFHDPRDIYGIGHGHALIPEVLDVPLIMSNIEPDAPNLASTVDIYPTILGELGIDDDDRIEFDGKPLQSEQDDRILYSEEIAYGYDQQAVITSENHLIHSPHESETVLLDRTNNEVIDDDEIIDEMLEYITFERKYGEKTPIDNDTKERLAELGYLE